MAWLFYVKSQDKTQYRWVVLFAISQQIQDKYIVWKILSNLEIFTSNLLVEGGGGRGVGIRITWLGKIENLTWPTNSYQIWPHLFECVQIWSSGYWILCVKVCAFTVLLLIHNSYMSWSTRFVSLKVCVAFFIFYSVLLSLKFIFCSTKSMDS